MARHEDETGSDVFLVFLKTYEEAKCGLEDGCLFEWVDDASISSYSVAFDSDVNDYVLSFIGENLDATTSNTEVYIDGFE
jgi:hypothetical protein